MVSLAFGFRANIECDAENLIQFAIMGSAFYRDIHGSVSPSAGLLNVEKKTRRDLIICEAATVLGTDHLILTITDSWKVQI